MDEQLKPQITPLSPTVPETVQVGTLELREEMLEIVKERVRTGQVSFRREVQTRTETVTTELRRETLVIEVNTGAAEVYFGGELLQAGETREVLLYDEHAVVNKVPYVTEEVQIGKQTITEQQQHEVELKYEVLVVDEQQVQADHQQGEPS